MRLRLVIAGCLAGLAFGAHAQCVNPAVDKPSENVGAIVLLPGLTPPQITTSGPNELVMLYVWQLGDEQAGGVSPFPPVVTNVSEPAGLTWNRRGGRVTYVQSPATCGGGRCAISQDVFWAFSKAKLTNDTVTVTLANPPPSSGPQNFQVAGLFGVTNVINPGNPFDANVSLPATNSANLDGLNYNVTFTTNLTTDLLLVSCGSIAITPPFCNIQPSPSWAQTLETDRSDVGGVRFNSVYTQVPAGGAQNITAGTFNWYASADAIVGCGGPAPQLYPFVWIEE